MWTAQLLEGIVREKCHKLGFHSSNFKKVYRLGYQKYKSNMNLTLIL